MKQYKAVIYGASAKGIGIAAQLPDQVLVVEKTSLAAREFAGAAGHGRRKVGGKDRAGEKIDGALSSKRDFNGRKADSDCGCCSP